MVSRVWVLHKVSGLGLKVIGIKLEECCGLENIGLGLSALVPLLGGAAV